MQRGPLPIDVPPVKILSAILNGITLEILFGDILNMTADIIVNAANDRMDHAGGLALAIKQAAGPAFQDECNNWIRQNGTIRPGEVAVTGSGDLCNKFAGIIHAVGPNGNDTPDNREMLISTLVNSMRKACEFNKTSIGFPAISAGIYGFPKDVCAKCHIDAFIIYAAQIFVNDSNSSLKQVTFVLFETDTLKVFVAEVLKRMEIFEFFHHLGLPEEKALGIVYSMCELCHQSFMLHHFNISLDCCVKVCDFCFYDNPTNTCYSCRKYITSANDTNIKKMCRICYQTYPRNGPMHSCQA